MLVYKIGDIENRAALQWIEIIFLETGLHPRIAFNDEAFHWDHFVE